MIDLLDKIPEDKQKHIAVGVLLGLALGAHFLIAVVVILIAALGKEAYDYIYNMFISDVHDVDLYDSLATIGGGAVGIVLIYVINSVIGVLV